MVTPTPINTSTVVIRLKAATPPALRAAHDVELSVPQTAGRNALRKLLYHLLDLHDHPQPDFHFLVNDEPLRTTLDKFLQRRSISAERTLEVTYYVPLPTPQRQESVNASKEWLSSVACYDGKDNEPVVVVGSYSGAPAVFRGSRSLVAETACEDGRHIAPIKGVAWMHDCTRFVTASLDQNVHIWQLDNTEEGGDDATARVIATFCSEDAGEPIAFTSIAVSASLAKGDGGGRERIAVGGNDGSVWLLSPPTDADARTSAKATENKKRRSVDVAAISATRVGAGAPGSMVSCIGWRDATLLSGGWDGVLRTWDVATCQAGATLPCGGKGVTGLAAGHTVTCVSGIDGGVRIIDGRDGRGVVAACGRRRAHAGAVTDVDWLPGERHVVSGGVDGTVRLWDVRAMMAPTREIADVHEGLSSMAVCCSSSKIDSKPARIFSVGADGKLAAFSVELGAEEPIA